MSHNLHVAFKGLEHCAHTTPQKIFFAVESIHTQPTRKQYTLMQVRQPFVKHFGARTIVNNRLR